MCIMAQDDLDYALALSLQEEFNRNSIPSPPKCLKAPPPVHNVGREYDPRSIVDSSWELTDPNPNIHDLFVRFDQMFFEGTLVSRGVVVSWSNRMTLCAGVCSYQGRAGFCSIRLSQSLLKLRPRRDLVQTLLHEMIHAYLFVTHNNTDHDGHGPNFQSHMNRINSLTGAKITIYHSFRDEVQVYKQHWWRCNGPCQKRQPYFGYVKRAMNRAPSPRDPWWAEHQRTCGGTYIKIKEPEGYKKKGEGKGKGHILGRGSSQSGGKHSSANKGKVKGRGPDGENSQAGTKHRPVKKGKVKGDISTGTSMKIDEMFPKSDNKPRDQPVLVESGDDSQAIPSTDDCESRRSKMLAAAERRLMENSNRGVRTAAVAGKRPVSHGSRDVREYGGHVAKKPKLEDASSLRTSPVVDLRPTMSDSTEESQSTTVIDLCEDSFEQPRPGWSVNSGSQNSPISQPQESNTSSQQSIYIDDHSSAKSVDHPKAGQDSLSGEKNGDCSGVVVIDDAEDVTGSGSGTSSDEDPVVVVDEDGFKTCPVCGLNGIPEVIINAHVAFCLDEEDWDDQ